MDTLEKYNEKTFEDIKHIDECGNEYWYARELQVALDYKRWDKFCNVIESAKIACENSNNAVLNHFSQAGKMVEIGSGAKRKQMDFKLSRYEYSMLTEDEKRFYQRNLTRKGNYSLNQVAKKCGVKNFDKFHNAGYRGLYNGETADDIAKRKGLRYREDILDNMGSEELAANLFRISQTESKLKRDNVTGEKDANETHYNIGKNIREVIAKNGGTMPEDLPTPKKSLKELEKEEIKKLKENN